MFLPLQLQVQLVFTQLIDNQEHQIHNVHEIFKRIHRNILHEMPVFLNHFYHLCRGHNLFQMADILRRIQASYLAADKAAQIVALHHNRDRHLQKTTWTEIDTWLLHNRCLNGSEGIG